MGNLILQTRQRELLSILKMQKTLITGTELAKKLEVSDRTVRSDIAYLNSVLDSYDAEIIAQKGKGYYLKMQESSDLQKLFNVSINLQTKEERARYLILLMIISNKSYTLGEMEDLVFVSRTTLENDIRYMQAQFMQKQPYLKIIRRGNEIECENDERKKRTVLSKLFVEDWDSRSQMGLNFQNDLLEPESFHMVLDRVREHLDRYEIKVDDYGMMDLVFSIAIARVRIQAGCELLEEETEFTVDSHLMNVMSELVDEFEGIWNVKFDHAEREEIARILQIRQTFDWKISTKEDLYKFVTPTRIEVVTRLLEEIKELYGVDLMGDDSLFIGLVRHVMSMLGRLRFRYERRSPVLQTVKAEYPMALEYAILFRRHFSDLFHYDLGEDEVSFIASYLMNALDRNNRKLHPKGVPVAFVSHMNLSSTMLFILQIRAIFGENIDFLGPFSVYEGKNVVESNPVFVLSTLPPDFQGASVPNITLTMPLTAEHITAISRMLINVRSEIYYPPLYQSLGAFLREDLFFEGVEADSKKRVIELLANAITEKGYAPPEFTKNVLSREELCATAYSCGLALPHCSRCFAAESVMAVAVLARPILWDGKRVSRVIMPALSEADYRYAGHFLHIGVHAENDRDFSSEIMSCEKFEGFQVLLS